MTDDEDNKDDQLSRNYKDMNETGKEKLKEVSESLLKIWNTVNDEKTELKSEQGIKN